MDVRTTSTEPAASSSDVIELVVPMRAEYASTLRTLAASVGADLGFSIDELDDVRLAISEVFSVLVDGGSAGRARVEMRTTDTTLSVRLGRVGDTGDPPAELHLDDLAEQILRSVTDSFDVDPDGIAFVKRGTEHGPSHP